VNSGKEICRELVVTGGDPTKVLETAEAALDDVSTFVGSFVEAMKEDPIGLVRNDRLCATLDDLRAQCIAVIPFVSD